MPSVRFSRDKRGYEYVYLVHTPVKRGKTGRTRTLYWYRSPPGIRLGRQPFDEEVQRTLERQNPDIRFDWEAIIATPMPPPDMTEFWRERRRLEKAARQERKADEAAEQQHVEAASPDDASDAAASVEEGSQEAPSDAETAAPVGDSSFGSRVSTRRRRSFRRGSGGQNTR